MQLSVLMSCIAYITWWLTEPCFGCEKVDPSITRQVVQKVVTDNASNGIMKFGEIQVKTNWTRLAIDVNYIRGMLYLSMVDCGIG